VSGGRCELCITLLQWTASGATGRCGAAATRRVALASGPARATVTARTTAADRVSATRRRWSSAMTSHAPVSCRPSC